MKVEDFADKTPVFAPEIFFSGHTHSWGMVETASGAPDQEFSSDASGSVDEKGMLKLEQHFTFADNKMTERRWTFIKVDDHHYTGTANDIIGTAEGEAYGNVFHWTYTLALTPGNPLKNVYMDQWMYLQADGSVVNRVAIRKLGFIVAQVTEYFQHLSDQPAIPAY